MSYGAVAVNMRKQDHYRAVASRIEGIHRAGGQSYLKIFSTIARRPVDAMVLLKLKRGGLYEGQWQCDGSWEWQKQNTTPCSPRLVWFGALIQSITELGALIQSFTYFGALIQTLTELT